MSRLTNPLVWTAIQFLGISGMLFGIITLIIKPTYVFAASALITVITEIMLRNLAIKTKKTLEELRKGE